MLCQFRSQWSLLVTLLLLLSFCLLSGGCTKKVLPPVKSVSTSGSASNSRYIDTRKALGTFYRDWKGTPYRMGGMSKRSVDCSALTVIAYRDIFGVSLPRTVDDQARVGSYVAQHALKPGDLVFFKTGFFQRHVGIYLEDRRFIHASSSNGVMISRLDEPYWSRKYWKATRAYTL